MKFTVYEIDTGKLLGSFKTSYNSTEYYTEDGVTDAISGWPEGDQYVLNGLFADRPTLPVPETKTLSVDEDWIIVPIPSGTEVYTDDVLVGTADGSDLTLSFPSGGEWSVKLIPPFPYKVANIGVTVT